MAAPRDDMERVSGADTMAMPAPTGRTSVRAAHNVGSSSNANTDGNTGATPSQPESGAPKKKRHRGGKNRRRNRRQSFVAPSEATEEAVEVEDRPSLLDVPNPRASTNQASFYRLQSGGNRSNTSLDSEALLDHREQAPYRSRRQSIQQSLQQGFARASLPFGRPGHRGSQTSVQNPGAQRTSRLALSQSVGIGEDEEHDANDRTPLLNPSYNRSRSDLSRNASAQNYGSHHAQSGLRQRRSSATSKASTRHRVEIALHHAEREGSEEYDVNNPPSMPGTPKLGGLDELMADDFHAGSDRGRDAIINIDDEDDYADQRRYSSSSPEAARRRPTVAELAERDVCFPTDGGLSEIGEDEERQSQFGSGRARRRRPRAWPDLEILEEWSREEKEARTQQEQIRAKKISEPVMVGGRLRPGKTAWHREEDDSPFRFTYFNELLDGTIHARTISDLCQDGGTFKELFLPDPVELSDDSDDDESDDRLERSNLHTLNGKLQPGQASKQPSSQSEPGDSKRSPSASKSGTGSNTPSVGPTSQAPTPRPHTQGRQQKRYGARPTFWLDVLKPTELEMKVLAKTFNIHQLTTEDILMEEPREKVELFQSYYFVNYRSFEQDKDSDDYMEPVNMYVVVFRDGVISFHHSMTPHPANVRRRVRQLNDYMSPTADWISYAIIDDITDVYAPLVQRIEEEVDDIDDEILYMHQTSADKAVGDEERHRERDKRYGEKRQIASDASNQGDMGTSKTEGEKTAGESGGDMLRRVGECRKKVMGLYRLLGNKADVIKGFAKRCNEHWEVAPRSEIGLYLGDIQDHIVTMTGNLSHYEDLLSRAHSNYLAQINIRMNERAEQTADVLGKLTVLGTIVLPMNIVTGMWGMNVWVPGQEHEGNLTWFWCITAGLAAFGLTCYFIAKRVYGIV